ncbi:MAG: S53 family peptidase [Alphaproteobacteria bacterium]|nr:S53 family peptidase [Alphaproteobacteria bacterium]
MERRCPSHLLLLCSAIAIGMANFYNDRAEAQPVRGEGQVVTPESGLVRPEDTGVRAHTHVKLFVPASGLGSVAPPSPSGAAAPGELPPVSGAYYSNTPASLACVYGLVPRQSDGCNPYVVTRNPSGGSRAIAVVDAFDAPNAASDLAVFSAQFGLPTPTSANFQVIYASAGACTASGTKPAYDSGWEAEASLDVQWAHAMAPHAKVYLVEAASDGLTDLFAAVAVASQCVAENGGGEVSMSWGFSEFPGETAYDSIFTQKSVVYFAGAGDSPGALYPSASPNVVSVGGTSLVRNPLPWQGNLGDFKGEVVWNWGPSGGTGGGPSAYEPCPAYQLLIQNMVGSSRGTPDVAAVADPFTGVWIYDSNFVGWLAVGGTSVSTPVWAGIVNAAGRFHNSTAAELAEIYASSAFFEESFGGFTDITSGACGIGPDFEGLLATEGWDFCSGVGSPLGYFGK